MKYSNQNSANIKASQVIEYFQAKTEEQIQQKKDVFLTKDDKVELIDRINKAKVETIIWMVSTGIAIVGLLSGIVFAMLNAYLKK
ncbi:MAG: hypothetical protein LBE82_05935 [Chitinophagaceae bacterium]|jgi:hypothetical protein|nr:hypothetical protein [Chitinophagaceae bacterium]